MKRTALVFILSLLLALPAMAMGRNGIFIKTADYDSGQVVVEGYPAGMAYNMYQSAGLVPGDRILSVAGKKVTSPKGFNEIMESLKPNEKVKVKVLRSGKEVELTLKPAADDFNFMGSLGKLLAKGDKIKIAVVVTSAYDQKDPSMGPDGRVDTARKFWEKLPYTVMGEIVQRNDYGKYTAGLSFADTALSRNISDLFAGRKSGKLTDDERKMIKERTGATHVLTVDYASISPEPERALNKIDMAIVDLSTGEVVGKTHLETLYDTSNGKELMGTVDGYEKKKD